MLMMETLFCVKSFLSYPRVKSDATPSIVWVSQLIDETSLSWNIQKFKEVFEEEEVKNIEAIPIAMFWGEDKLTWHFSRSCMYSVKSGYWVACDIRDGYPLINIAERGPSSMLGIGISGGRFGDFIFLLN